MANIKQFITPDNLGTDFEQDATAKEIKVNIDGVSLIRNAEGKLQAVGGGGEDSGVYNITELPEGATAPNATRVNALAAGVGAEASGLNSVAIGINANASGIQSTALGSNAVASGLQSTALGNGAMTSKSRQVSIAPLSETTHLSANPRLLSGVKTPEVGQDAANKDYVDDHIKVYNITELPEGATAPKANAVILDLDTMEEVEGPDPSGYVVAIGAGAEATGMVVELPEGGGYAWMPSLAIGGNFAYNSEGLPLYVPASSEAAGIAIFGLAGETSIAIGNASEATAASIAIGNTTEATGNTAIAIGNGAEASGTTALAIGDATEATDLSAIAIGYNANATEIHSIALGASAKTSKTFQVSIAKLDETTHLSTNPRLLSGVKAPEVGQDAANKDYVDNYIKAKVEALPEGATLEDLITALKS